MRVYEGYDDSPGAQGLGLITVISGTVCMIKNRKKKRAEPKALLSSFILI